MTRAAMVLVAALAATASAQIEVPDWDNAVSFEVVQSQDRLRPGDRIELAVVARIEEGYHLYGPEEMEPSRTEIEVVSEGLQVSEPSFPPVVRRDLAGLGTYDLFEGDIAIRVPVTLASDAKAGESHPASVTVRYQVCTDFACSAPDSETLEVELPTGPKGSPVQARHAEIFKK